MKKKYDLSVDELSVIDDLISYLGKSTTEDLAKAGLSHITIAALDTAPNYVTQNISCPFTNKVADYAVAGAIQKKEDIESLLKKIDNPEGLNLEKLIAIRNQHS